MQVQPMCLEERMKTSQALNFSSRFYTLPGYVVSFSHKDIVDFKEGKSFELEVHGLEINNQPVRILILGGPPGVLESSFSPLPFGIVPFTMYLPRSLSEEKLVNHLSENYFGIKRPHEVNVYAAFIKMELEKTPEIKTYK